MNKSFVILLVIAAIWGVSLGMVFIAGLTIGKTQSDVETLAVPASIQTFPEQASEVSQFGQGQREELDRFRQRFREGSERGGPGGGGFRRGGFGDQADGQNGAVDSGRELQEAPTPEPSK